MTSTTPLITEATLRDRDTIGDTIAEAFFPLDVIQHLVPDTGRRRPVSRAWYLQHIDHAIGGAGKVFMIDNRAAAVWFDRTGKVKVTEPEDYAKRLAAATGPDLPRFRDLDTQMEALHPTDPQWHLLFLAVRRPWQGRGLGSRLLDHTHEWLDRNGYTAYLEATGDANEKLYQRHGYQLMTPPAIRLTPSLHLRRMWRPIQTD